MKIEMQCPCGMKGSWEDEDRLEAQRFARFFQDEHAVHYGKWKPNVGLASENGKVDDAKNHHNQNHERHEQIQPS